MRCVSMLRTMVQFLQFFLVTYPVTYQIFSFFFFGSDQDELA